MKTVTKWESCEDAKRRAEAKKTGKSFKQTASPKGNKQRMCKKPVKEGASPCGGIQQKPILPPQEADMPFLDPALAGNEQIEEMIRLFHQQQTHELFTAICLTIRERMAKDGHFIFPADITEDEEGSTLFTFKTLDLEIGPALVAFTGLEEKEKAPHSGAVSHFIDTLLESLLQMEEIRGLILNPWGEPLFLGKEDIGMILTPGSERFL